MKRLQNQIIYIIAAAVIFIAAAAPKTYADSEPKIAYGNFTVSGNAVTLPVMNVSPTETAFVFIAAVYKDGCLCSLDSKNMTLRAYEETLAEIKNVDLDGQMDIRVFLWNNLEEIVPLENRMDLFAPRQLNTDFPNGTHAAAYGSVPLRWQFEENMGTNVAYYQIDRNGTFIANTKDCCYTDTGLEAGKEYTYRVRAISHLGIISSDASIIVRMPEEATLYYQSDGLEGTNLKQLESMPETSGAANINRLAVKDGVSCVLAEPVSGKTKYVSYDIDDQFLQGDGINGISATFFVTFFDNGTEAVRFDYDSIYDNENAAPGYTYLTFPRYNTNTWRTVEISVSDGDFRNSQSTAVGGVSVGADFRLTGGNSQLFVSEIKIVPHTAKIEAESYADWRDVLLCARIFSQDQADLYGNLITRLEAEKLIHLAAGKFGLDMEMPQHPDEIIYPNEFLYLYLSALGYQTNESTVMEKAAELNLWEKGNDFPINYGDAAWILANGLQTPANGQTEPSFSLVLESGLITKDEIRESEHQKLIYLMNGGRNMQLEMKTKTDPVTKREYMLIGKEKSGTATFYFTGGSSFTADSNQIILNMNYHEGSSECMFGLFNMETQTTETIAEDVHFYEGITGPTNLFFYTKGREAYLYDINTQKTRLIGENPDGRAFYGPPSMTFDGKTASVYWKDEEGKTRNAGLFDLETGEFTKILSPEQVMDIFEAPQNFFDHPILNPQDKNTVFFNRGNDTYIPDRMYLLDVPTGNIKNMYQQQMMPDGSLGEAIGHESWSFDGEWMYFVKYSAPFSKLEPMGIMRVSKDCSQYEYVNTDHPFWHASPSPDGKWVVGDYFLIEEGNGRLKSKVAICNVETGESQVLAEFYISGQHPAHPHPAFSFDGKKICFTVLGDEDEFNCKAAVMDVSDIVSGY